MVYPDEFQLAMQNLEEMAEEMAEERANKKEDEIKTPHILAGDLFINGNSINTILLERDKNRVKIATNNNGVEQFISSSTAKGLYEHIIATIREGKSSLIDIPGERENRSEKHD